MIQYGLRTKEGTYLPRDAYRRGMSNERFKGPDLWQDKATAERYASQYDCELVEFIVETFEDRNGLIKPSHGGQ